MSDLVDSRPPAATLSPAVYASLDRLTTDAAAATRALREARGHLPSTMYAALLVAHCGISAEIKNLRSIVSASAQTGNGPQRPLVVRMEDMEIHPVNYERLELDLHRAGDHTQDRDTEEGRV